MPVAGSTKLRMGCLWLILCIFYLFWVADFCWHGICSSKSERRCSPGTGQDESNPQPASPEGAPPGACIFSGEVFCQGVGRRSRSPEPAGGRLYCFTPDFLAPSCPPRLLKAPLPGPAHRQLSLPGSGVKCYSSLTNLYRPSTPSVAPDTTFYIGF